MKPVRILRPDQIQPPLDPARVIGEAGERPVTKLIQQGIDALENTLDSAAIIAMIAENRFDALWRHLGLERIGAMIRPALNRLAVIHDKSAIEASLGISAAPVLKARPSKLKTPAVIHLTYDPLDPATVAQQNADNQTIIDNLQKASENNAASVLSIGLAHGDRPAVIARALRETLSMSPQESNAIESYRATLEDNPASTAARALRDRRYDATIRRGELSEDQINRMVARYAQRYRTFRASRIARTESLRAANQGRAAAWAQYKALTGRDYRRFWLTAGDELVCAVCAPIPEMNPDGVGPDEDYATPIGPIKAPPDTHPQCRCTERFMHTSGDESP